MGVRVLEELSISKPLKVTDPTAGWKMYRNEEYGFEFKYPTIKDWYMNESITDQASIVSLEHGRTRASKNRLNHYLEAFIDVAAFINHNNQSLEDFMKENYPEQRELVSFIRFIFMLLQNRQLTLLKKNPYFNNYSEHFDI